MTSSLPWKTETLGDSASKLITKLVSIICPIPDVQMGALVEATILQTWSVCKRSTGTDCDKKHLEAEALTRFVPSMHHGWPTHWICISELDCNLKWSRYCKPKQMQWEVIHHIFYLWDIKKSWNETCHQKSLRIPIDQTNAQSHHS